MTNEHIDQWNRMEVPDINPYNYSHVSFHKNFKNTHWRNDNLFKKGCIELKTVVNGTQMTTKHVEKLAISLANREVQINNYIRILPFPSQNYIEKQQQILVRIWAKHKP